MPMKRVAYHLTETQIRDIKALSKKTGIPVAEYIRRQVDKFLDEQADKRR